ncbi:AGZA family xanthine/uracil permease-like MFS transporter [Haloferula luteola]|uniref:AGZA family xanthine/uracil permease-like MFS transporter n=1 Tax=Haloferula luteola TaxID=595692 RepID=A0A840V513_9BACT|nr:NCS2 family permease [Haloferula luteola]MBB5352126.1 AGZA family xanthine/uracil permease-like MFS transporter [Haloferula luteola]
MIERLFRLREHGSTPAREVLAGCTTFAAMAYILVVNPAILADAGMPRAALVTATAVGAAMATLLMALLANLPLAMAPGMGINAFFAYAVCVGMGIPWQSALGFVCLNGVIFLALSVGGVRRKIVEAIPLPLKAAIAAGIGLFIAFIGLKNGGLVVANPATFVSLGDLTSPPVALFAVGVLLTCGLVARRTPAAILISVGVLAVIGLWVPNGQGGRVTQLPETWVSLPASIEPVFLKLDFGYVLREPLRALPVILTLLLVDLFDNIGTLIGVTKRAGLMNAQGEVPRLQRALTADSLAAILSSLLGTSTVVSYIESATGVQAGGRTGLTGVTVAVLFLLALFLTPILLAIPGVAVAPALVVVGILMFESMGEIDLKRFELAAPAVLTVIGMPFTFSISTGMGMGLIAAVVVSLVSGRGRENLTPFTCGLAGVFLLHFLEPWWLRHGG